MEDAECMAVDLQVHELPKGWSDAGVQTEVANPLPNRLSKMLNA